LTSLLRMLAFLAIKNNAWSTRSLWSYRLSPGDTPTSIGRIFFFPFWQYHRAKRNEGCWMYLTANSAISLFGCFQLHTQVNWTADSIQVKKIKI
jgi:hypothetical protein